MWLVVEATRQRRCVDAALTFRAIAVALLLATGCRSVPGGVARVEGLSPKIGAPTALAFWGEPYYARFSATRGPTCMVEYYLASEEPRQWTRMLALRLDPSGPDGSALATGLESMIKASGNQAVSAYQTTNGPGVEYVRTIGNRQEVSAIRYQNRQNGTVVLQYSEIIPSDVVRKLTTAQRMIFYTNIRSNAAWGLERMEMPPIERLR